MSQKKNSINAYIRLMGLSLFIISITLFSVLLFMGDYRLNEAILEQTIEASHLESLRPGLQGMIDKNYTSKLDFLSDFNGVLETVNANWMVLLDEGAGRLRVNIRHVKLRSSEQEEAIDFRLTTRGPIDSTDGKAVEAALDIGHDAIVRTFVHRGWSLVHFVRCSPDYLSSPAEFSAPSDRKRNWACKKQFHSCQMNFSALVPVLVLSDRKA